MRHLGPFAKRDSEGFLAHYLLIQVNRAHLNPTYIELTYLEHVRNDVQFTASPVTFCCAMCWTAKATVSPVPKRLLAFLFRRRQVTRINALCVAKRTVSVISFGRDWSCCQANRWGVRCIVLRDLL